MQNWSILAKFAKKIQRNRLFFTDCFLVKFPPRNLGWNRLIFLRICPRKSFEIGLFSTNIPRNWPIFLRILIFLPQKSREICWFFHEFAPENLAKFCFFAAKYQKPCHQYGIFGSESHTFLLAKCCQWRGVRRNGCFRRLPGNWIVKMSLFPTTNNYYYFIYLASWNFSESPATFKWLPNTRQQT